MTSREQHLTNQLIKAAENGIFHAIKPLIEYGAYVNGMPTEYSGNDDEDCANEYSGNDDEDCANEYSDGESRFHIHNFPSIYSNDNDVVSPLNNVITHIIYEDLDDYGKLDYMLTFHEMFAHGADVYFVDYYYHDVMDILYSRIGMQAVVLFLQYGAGRCISNLLLDSDYKLSIHDAMCHHGYRGRSFESNYVDTKLLCSITPGLLKDYFVRCGNSESLFLEFAQEIKHMLVVEFSFSIDFYIGLI